MSGGLKDALAWTGAAIAGAALILSAAGCAAAGQRDTGTVSVPSSSSSSEATTLRSLMDSPAQSPTLTVVEELRTQTPSPLTS